MPQGRGCSDECDACMTEGWTVAAPNHTWESAGLLLHQLRSNLLTREKPSWKCCSALQIQPGAGKAGCHPRALHSCSSRDVEHLGHSRCSQGCPHHWPSSIRPRMLQCLFLFPVFVLILQESLTPMCKHYCTTTRHEQSIPGTEISYSQLSCWSQAPDSLDKYAPRIFCTFTACIFHCLARQTLPALLPRCFPTVLLNIY